MDELSKFFTDDEATLILKKFLITRGDEGATEAEMHALFERLDKVRFEARLVDALVSDAAEANGVAMTVDFKGDQLLWSARDFGDSLKTAEFHTDD